MKFVLNFFTCLSIMPSLSFSTQSLSSDASSSDYNHYSQKKRVESSLGFHQLYDDLHFSVSSFLRDQDIGRLSLTNRECDGFFSNNHHISVGSLHRRCSKFYVKDQNGKTYYLEEYLSQDQRLPIAKVNHVNLLAQERPEDFLKLMLKSIPHTQSAIKKDLKTYSHKVMQIESLIDQLPSYQNPSAKLAAFILDVITWDQMNSKVAFYIWNKFGFEYNRHTRDLLASDQWFHVWQKISYLDWGDMNLNILTDISRNIYQQIDLQMTKKVLQQIWEDLYYYDLTPTLESSHLSEIIVPAIDYCFALNFLASIPMRHSRAYLDIVERPESGLISLINEHVGNERAQEILANIKLPHNDNDNDYLKKHLTILNRHLVLSR